MPTRLLWNARADRKTPPPTDGYPLPSPKLRYRVHGAVDQKSFLEVGEACAHDIVAIVDRLSIAPPAGGAVLDFGCGCGRVLRFMFGLRPDWNYTGVDIDGEATDWCKSAYPQASFAQTPGLPPTQLADASFDFTFVISVFTHLDEDYQNAWLAELRRITKPGGHVLATVAGAVDQSVLPAADQAELDAKGFLHRAWRRGRLKLDGLPDFYNSTLHTRDYVEQNWPRASGMDLVAYLPGGINQHQDAVVLKRPES